MISSGNLKISEQNENKENINKNYNFSFSLVTNDEGKLINLICKNLSLITAFPQKLLKLIETFSQTFLIITLIQELILQGFQLTV